jgi:acetylornithine deacetylase
MASSTQRFERIARLIEKSSVSSAAPGWDQSNRAVIDELANQLDGVGFRIEILPLPEAPHKANLIATLGQGEGGLVLAGHTDTVPYDGALWSSDPFKLTERDGKLYGLGTSDMKAFLALALEAAEGVAADSLRAPLIVLATADEESTMGGARALVQLGRPRGRHAIIGEPTDLRPVRAHKGIMMERIRVIGQSGHSSNPAYGNSALDGMTKILIALLTLRADLVQRYRDPGFEVPSPTLNLGRIQGGDSANRICGECELDIDVRLLPGMDADWVRSELNARCERALAGSGLTLQLTSVVAGTPAHELSADSELLRAAEQLTGEGATSVAFATEAPYLAALGTDTIVLGPGGISEAHRPDEFVRIDRLEPTVEVLRAMVQRLCKDAHS